MRIEGEAGVGFDLEQIDDGVDLLPIDVLLFWDIIHKLLYNRLKVVFHVLLLEEGVGKLLAFLDDFLFDELNVFCQGCDVEIQRS